MLLQMGAMQMQMMARGYFVYEMTRSPAILGIVSAATALPTLLFALPGGVIADRLDKKRIILTGQALSMLLALLIAVAITTGIINWQYLLVAALVHGTIIPLMMPARQAIIPQLVGKDQLMNAIALNSLAMSLTTLAAPAAAGWLIAAIGMDGVYYLMAGTYVGSLLFTGMLPRARGTSGETRPHTPMLAGITDGIRYVWTERGLLHLLLLAFSVIILTMPIRFVLPIFARDVFMVGPGGLGIMMSVMGVGGLAGALVIASLGQGARRGLLLAGTAVAAGVALLGFSGLSLLAPLLAFGLGFLALVGLTQSGVMTLSNTLIMEYTDQEYRGRVSSIFMLSFGLMPAGVLPITIAAEYIGAPLALGIMALLLMLIASLLTASPHLRRLA